MRNSDGYYWNGTSFVSGSENHLTATGTTGSRMLRFEGADHQRQLHCRCQGDRQRHQPLHRCPATFTYDTTAPVTTDNSASIGSGWFNTTQTVTLTPTDTGGSGVAATYYTTDGSTPTTSSSSGTSVVLSTNGVYTIKYFSVDKAGNAESVKTASTAIHIDTTAPTVTITVPAGNTTQASTSVSVTWTESDSGSGLNTATRSVQRQIATPVSNACTSVTWGNDGSATTSASPRNDTGLLSNNCYRWTVSISDNAGNNTTVTSGTVLVDTTAPTVTITVPANNGAYNTAGWAGSLSGTAADSGSGLANVKVSIKRNSDGYYWNGTSFVSGSENYLTATGTTGWTYALASSALTTNVSYTVDAKATDNATNPSTVATATFTYDTTAPVTTDNSASIGSGWFNTTQTVTLTPTDTGGSGVAATYYTTDGSTPTTSSSSGTSVVLSTNGVYTIKYFSVDKAGNAESVKTASTAIHIDTTAPTVTITVPANNGAYNTAGWAGSLSGTAADSGSGLANVKVSIKRNSDGYYWNGTSFVSGSENYLTATGTTGWTYALASSALTTNVSYTVDAKATDNATNPSTVATATFTYDTTAPAAPTITSSNPASPSNTSTTPALIGTAETGSTVKIYTNSTCTSASPVTGTAAAFTSTGLTVTVGANTTTSFYATATDAAGNVSACSTPAFTYTNDTTAPTVTINQAVGQADPTNASPIHFTVVFSESVSGFDASDIALSGAAGATTALVTSTGSNTYDVAVSGMTAGGTVIATVTASAAVDAAGNASLASTSSDNIVTFQATPVITWANPAGIAYGTPLSATQLDATASVPGSFVYTPAAGTVLGVGAGQTLSTTFTPTDTTDYTIATKSVTINVTPGPLNHLVLSPTTATVNPGVGQDYTAEGFDAGNNDLGDVTSATTFSIAGGTCTGASCTSTTAGDHIVTGTDGTATGTATLTITGVLSVVSGDTYHAINPTRILDTRNGTGGISGAIGEHSAHTFQVAGVGGVPSNAAAVTGNLTVTGQTSLGYLFLGPTGQNNPTSSTINFPKGDDRANAVTVALSTGGTLSVTFVAPTAGQSTYVIFDVTGYFTADTSGATFHALNPARVLDTRNGTGGISGRIAEHSPQTFTVAGVGGVPSNATAVTGNLTVTGQTSLGYLFLGPTGTANPTSSTLNFPVGDDRANAVTVALSSTGTLSVTYVAPSAGQSSYVIFDVTGYFTQDMTGAVSSRSILPDPRHPQRHRWHLRPSSASIRLRRSRSAATAECRRAPAPSPAT